MSKMKEQEVKPDKGGDRGGKHGMGKTGSSHSGFSDGEVKKGYKKLQTLPVLTKGHTKGLVGTKDSLKNVAP